MIEVDRGQVWTITLNRPDKANALTAAMLSELADLAQEADAVQPAALILTGRGKVFSAGADLDAAKKGLATNRDWERLSRTLAALPFPTIAALNGTLAGGAFGMALACDMRIARPGARFFYPVMALGFLPQPSDPIRLRDLIGPARAAMILLAGAKIDATEALSWGLIDRIVDGDLMAEARALTEPTLAANPRHRAQINRLLRR